MISIATCFFSEDLPKQLDQDEVIVILDQAKSLEWHEAMSNDGRKY
jgi:hypothetical protein